MPRKRGKKKWWWWKNRKWRRNPRFIPIPMDQDPWDEDDLNDSDLDMRRWNFGPRDPRPYESYSRYKRHYEDEDDSPYGKRRKYDPYTPTANYKEGTGWWDRVGQWVTDNPAWGGIGSVGLAMGSMPLTWKLKSMWDRWRHNRYYRNYDWARMNPADGHYWND